MIAPKTAAAGLGGALTGVLIWILTDGFHVQVSGEHAAYLATLVAVACSYFAPRQPPTVEDTAKILLADNITKGRLAVPDSPAPDGSPPTIPL